MSKSFHQPVGSNTIHCVQFGHGKRLMVAFHGFGDSASTFEVLEPSLGKRYTVVSVDLPFHGNTIWPGGEKFTTQQALALVTGLMQQHNVETVSLAAFSIGGKIALKVFQLMPEKIESMWLFAPDGLQQNVWYNFAVYTKLGRKLFRRFLDVPNVLIGLVTTLQSLRVLPKSFATFIKYNLKTTDARERVWNTWIGFADFKVSPRQLRGSLMRHNTPCHIFIGQHDSVITPCIGRNFVNGIPNAGLIVLQKGHYILKPYLNEEIEKLLNA